MVSLPLKPQNAGRSRVFKALLLVCVLLAACAGWHERGFIRRLAHETKVHYFGISSPTLGTILPADEMYPVLQKDEREKLGKAIRLSFCGDLILLRDAVENGFNETTGTYDFSPMFKEVAEYWKSADLAVGVFEGPMAGEERGYSTSCYGDGIPLHLNFPDAFARNIKDAGIGLVTTANNHMLDMGEEGAVRTLDVLEAVGLDHLGTYRTVQEHDAVEIRHVCGKKVAFVAYTYGSNGYPPEYFLSPDRKHLTRYLAAPGSPFQAASMAQVREDFRRIRAENPDLIVAMPHIGTQFLHAADGCQKFWTDVFVQEGADIIMVDHSHAVQPVEWRRKANGRNALVAYCPGNFVNSYTAYDGDASMLVEVYLDPASGEPFAAAVIPVYAYCGSYGGKDHQWQGLPLYKAFRDEKWQGRLSHRDELRLQEVHRIVTKAALGHELSADQLQERYYTLAGQGYKRNPVPALELQPSDRAGEIIKAVQAAGCVAFVGDSVTEGTKNGGYGWFEPLAAAFPGKRIMKFAKGSMTSCWFREKRAEIAALHADLYVLAYGCNDIRYRDPARCAMTAADYIANVDALVQSVRKECPQARLAYIAPWHSAPYDPVCKCSREEKDRLYAVYTAALQQYCGQNEILFIDPNPYIDGKRARRFWNSCMKNHIHPDADAGIRLYSEGVVRTCQTQEPNNQPG